MTEEEEKQFQSSNTCWMCKKLIDDEKVRDHCHTTGKFRGATHWSYKINFQLTKKVSVIFHNLRGYDSHFYELKKFDVKIDVVPNRLEKYMEFIDSKQFINFSLEKLIKKLSDNHFKYLTQESGSKNL